MEKWCLQRGLNSRPLVYKTSALPLSYRGFLSLRCPGYFDAIREEIKLPAIWSEGKKIGLDRDLNPGPRAPEARIIPLDHQAIDMWRGPPLLTWTKCLLLSFLYSLQRSSLAVVAEWLRRWTWNPMGSARVGSNPANCEKEIFLFTFTGPQIKWLCVCQVWGSNPRNLTIMRA